MVLGWRSEAGLSVCWRNSPRSRWWWRSESSKSRIQLRSPSCKPHTHNSNAATHKTCSNSARTALYQMPPRLCQSATIPLKDRLFKVRGSPAELLAKVQLQVHEPWLCSARLSRIAVAAAAFTCTPYTRFYSTHPATPSTLSTLHTLNDMPPSLHHPIDTFTPTHTSKPQCGITVGVEAKLPSIIAQGSHAGPTPPLSLAPEQASAARRQAEQHTKLLTSSRTCTSSGHRTRSAYINPSPIDNTPFRRSHRYNGLVHTHQLRAAYIQKTHVRDRVSYRAPHVRLLPQPNLPDSHNLLHFNLPPDTSILLFQQQHLQNTAIHARQH